MICERCEHDMILDRSGGDYRKLKCARCGWVWEGTVVSADLLPSRQPQCTVVVRWKAEQATFDEIGAARQLFPELKGESIQSLRARIGAQREWIVGDFLEISGERLKSRASGLGLEVL
jgi:hypothetical protein